MKRLVKWVFGAVLVFLLLAAVGLGMIYFTLFRGPGEAAPGGYAFDLENVRQLADSMPGDKPTEVRVETVAAFEWPQLLTMAGGSLGLVRMGCFSYQLVTPSGHYIIDTAMDREMAGTMPNVTFYDQAYERMQAAIASAQLIAITHEHLDHLGGLTKNPNVKSLHAALRLTHEQISDPERHQNPPFAEGALEGYEPLQYDEAVAIAPGVVLIEAPGHTQGSQLVFVEMADGKEVLFLGDVAWMWANVSEVTPRPKFVSEYVLPGGEDRPLVLSELRFLDEFARNEPGILQVPGHDMEIIRLALQNGDMFPMFAESRSKPAAEPRAGSETKVAEPDAAEGQVEEVQ